jgi:hypothetical protein
MDIIVSDDTIFRVNTISAVSNFLSKDEYIKGLEQPQQMHRQNSLIPNTNGQIVRFS